VSAPVNDQVVATEYVFDRRADGDLSRIPTALF
jgi:hypothetical protein